MYSHKVGPPRLLTAPIGAPAQGQTLLSSLAVMQEDWTGYLQLQTLLTKANIVLWFVSIDPLQPYIIYYI